MILTSNKALDILNSYMGKTSDDRWIEHSICVGDSAGKIANALNKKGYNLDVDKAMTLGYIHDIGKYTGESKGHVIRGYNYIKELGYDDEYANICLTHSYLNNDVLCTGGGIPGDIAFKAQFIENHKYTIYEKIINLCDLMCTDVCMTLEKRLINIILRKGVHENTVYHIKEAEKLKQEFDDMLGCSVYSLFDDIEV